MLHISEGKVQFDRQKYGVNGVGWYTLSEALYPVNYGIAKHRKSSWHNDERNTTNGKLKDGTCLSGNVFMVFEGHWKREYGH